MADFLTRDLLAHDYVMQMLNAMLQRPNIITRSQMSTDSMHQNALQRLCITMAREAITAGFEYADAFIAASARGPAPPEPPSAASLARGLPGRVAGGQAADAATVLAPMAPMEFLRHIAERNSAPKTPPGPQGGTGRLGQHVAGGQAADAAKTPARRRKAGRRSP